MRASFLLALNNKGHTNLHFPETCEQGSLPVGERIQDKTNDKKSEVAKSLKKFKHARLLESLIGHLVNSEVRKAEISRDISPLQGQTNKNKTSYFA